MRILITGAAGFVGTHLARYLREISPDVELHGTTITEPSDDAAEIVFHNIQLKEPEEVADLIARVKPDRIYHLAAQAFVPLSFKDPWDTLENNTLAQLNIILGCIRAEITPRILVISSAEVYGPVREADLPLTEDHPFRPTSPYSVSKITQEMLALQYFHSHNMPIMRVRPFNHFGPGQNTNFVAPAFAQQIARIEIGKQPPTMKVGDLSARRDFTDVRDIVRAYHLVLEQGIPGEVYNVASGTTHSIHELLNALLELTDQSIQVSVDEDRLRPTSIPILQGDYSRLCTTTGWTPQISFKQTLADILTDCRQRVN